MKKNRLVRNAVLMLLLIIGSAGTGYGMWNPVNAYLEYHDGGGGGSSKPSGGSSGGSHSYGGGSSSSSSSPSSGGGSSGSSSSSSNSSSSSSSGGGSSSSSSSSSSSGSSSSSSSGGGSSGGSSSSSSSSSGSGGESSDGDSSGSSSRPSGSGGSGGGSSTSAAERERIRQQHVQAIVQEINKAAQNAVTQANEAIETSVVGAIKAATTVLRKLRGAVQKYRDATRKPAEAAEAATAEDAEATPTVGDPVFISSGQFYVADSDTSFFYGTQAFSFARNLTTGIYPDGALGKNWACPLDTRIIRGTSDCNAAHLLSTIALNRKEIEKYRRRLISYQENPDTCAVLNKWSAYLDALEYQMNDLIARAKQNPQFNAFVQYGFEDVAKKAAATSLLLVEEDGSLLTFSYDYGTKKYECTTDGKKNRISITQTDGGKWLVRAIDGFERIYDQWGLPEQYSDRYGMGVTFTYSGKENARTKEIGAVTHGGKTMLSFEWNADGRLSAVKNAQTGKTVRYAYDKSGGLVRVTGANGDACAFTYDGKGDLTKITKPDGAFIQITYGTSTGDAVRRVYSVRNEAGAEEYFSGDYDAGTSCYRDPDGVSYSYTFKDGRITAENLPGGNRITRTYSDDGLVLSKADAYGKVSYSYDGYGNMTRASYDDGSTETWAYAQPYNTLTAYKDRDGITTSFSYDEKGSLIKAVRGGKTIGTYAVDSSGLTVSTEGIDGSNVYVYDARYLPVRDKRNGYEYDGQNRLVKLTDAEGRIWKWAYSEDGKTVSLETPAHLRIQKDYDARNDLVRYREEDLLTKECRLWEYDYDKRHLPTEERVAAGATRALAERALEKSRSWTYLPSGRLHTSTRWEETETLWGTAAGIRHTYAYADGTVCTEETSFVAKDGKPLGMASRVTYTERFENKLLVTMRTDADGNTTRILTDRNGAIRSVTDAAGRSTSFSYTPAGALQGHTNRYGGTITYQYDAATGKVASVSAGGAVRAQYAYDEQGRLLQEADAAGTLTRYAYTDSGKETSVRIQGSAGSAVIISDALERPVQVTVSGQGGNTVFRQQNAFLEERNELTVRTPETERRIRLNAWGQTVSDDAGARSFAYDAHGRCIRCGTGTQNTTITYNAFDLPSHIHDGESRTDILYDVHGNPVRQVTVGIVTWQGTYDAAGRLTTEAGLLRAERSYEYDAGGLLKKSLENGELLESYEYSADLRQVRVTDARGNARTETYDAYGRLVSETDRLGKKRTIAYDEKRGTVTCTDFNGSTLSVSAVPAQGKTLITYADGTTQEIQYDALGGVTLLRGAQDTQRYEYDRAHQMSAATFGTQKVSFTFDSAGRRTSMGTGSLHSAFVYDEAGRLAGIRANQYAGTFSYDARGYEKRITLPGNATVQREYDALGREVGTAHRDAAGTVIFAEVRVHGQDGRVACTADAHGNFRAYEYDAHGRLRKAVLPYDERLETAAAQELDECGQRVPDAARLPAETLPAALSAACTAGLRTLGISAAPRKAQRSWTETYAYDANGNRIQKTTPLGTVRYEYDAENRLTRIPGITPVEYTYDHNGNLLSRTSVYSQQRWSYGQGNRPVQQTIADYRAERTYSTRFAYDALGRRTTATDSDGTVTHYAYDGLGLDILYAWTEEAGLNARTGTTAGAATARYRSVDGTGGSPRTTDGGTGRCGFDRYYLRANGHGFLQLNENYSFALHRAAQSPLYAFATDVQGSVRSATGTGGQAAYTISYGTGGSALFSTWEGAAEAAAHGAELGFAGMPYDARSGSYQYGLRDYAPATARFQTKDPLRDGSNWYAYCDGDPVNFMDVAGLKIVPAGIRSYMQDGGKDVLLGKSTDETVYYAGCYLNFCTGTVNTLLGTDYTWAVLNGMTGADNDIFDDTYLGDINTDKFADQFNLKHDYWTAAKSDIKKELDNYDAQEQAYVITAQLPYSPTNDSWLHFVGVKGGVTSIDGRDYVEVVATSLQDTYECAKTHAYRLDWWLAKDGTVYVPVDKIVKIRAFWTESETAANKKNK